MPPFAPAEHTVHRFVREVSRSLEPGDRRVIYGCDHTGCAAIEIRGEHERSPFAAAHAAKAIKRAEKRRDSARRGGA